MALGPTTIILIIFIYCEGSNIVAEGKYSEMFEFFTLPSSKPTMVSCVYEGESTTANQLTVRWENPEVIPLQIIRFRYKLRPEDSNIDYDCKNSF